MRRRVSPNKSLIHNRACNAQEHQNSAVQPNDILVGETTDMSAESRLSSKPRHASSGAPVRDLVDKMLILCGARTICHGKTLAVRLGRKYRGAHVGHPNLDGPQPLLAQPLAICPDLIARSLGANGRSHLGSPTDGYT
jgi:hypothetical protein